MVQRSFKPKIPQGWPSFASHSKALPKQKPTLSPKRKRRQPFGQRRNLKNTNIG
jgi:hypothetical protein